MKSIYLPAAIFGFMLSSCVFGNLGVAQESAPPTSQQQPDTGVTGSLSAAIEEKLPDIEKKVAEIEQQLNSNEKVQELSAGILQPIYRLAENMSHPWFYWTAFMLMAAGVFSFALQLVLTKLALLLRLKLRLSEVFSDGLGLLISLTGLVLVTQAATENSSFTQSAAAVVSSAAVGLVVGFVFYLWGQRTEFDAARDPNIVVQPKSSR